MDKIIKHSIPLFIALIWIILTVRMFYFIHTYSVNLLYSDHWDVIDLILNGNFSQIATYQHNEHRPVIGLLLMRQLALMTKWNTRVETFTTGIILLMSSIIALVIKWRLNHRLYIFDISIPLLFLNLQQVEMLTWGFLITFILPLLFLMAEIFLFTYPRSVRRNIILLFILLLSAYSSFHGLFLCVITGVFFLLELKRFKLKASTYITLILVICSIFISYFINFNFTTSLAHIPPSFIYSLEYLIRFWANLYGYSHIFFLTVIVFCLTILGIVYSLVLILKEADFHYKIVIMSLILFSLLFTLSLIIGRNKFSIEVMIWSTRYVTFLIPLYFGLYLTICKISTVRPRQIILFFFLWFLVITSFIGEKQNLEVGKISKSALEKWKRCYLTTFSVINCNKILNTSIYPETGSVELQEKLHYLSTRKMNIFDEQ